MGRIKIEARRGVVQFTVKADGNGDEWERYDFPPSLAAKIGHAMLAEAEKLAPPPLPEKITERISEKRD